MKTNHKPCCNCPRVRSGNGFALVIVLSLMVLLTLLAVGLLTLSGVTLRASSQGKAMASARANARLALMLAIGELQRSAGPDQRVTARADILDETTANPQLTGVWESLEIKATVPPKPTDYEAAAKAAKFSAWLVSSPDIEASRLSAFASVPMISPVTLWGKGTLGDQALAKGLVTAAKVPLASSPGAASPGAMAWAVLDEGLKARVNTHYADDAVSVGAKTAELGAGERPGVEFIDGLAGLERKFFEQQAPESVALEKGITRLNFALAAETLAKDTREALRPLTHDVTTQSVGLFTDTAHGGFKQDFHLLTNASALPAGYTGKGVYASRLGMNPSAVPSDPRWESLHQFCRLYRDKITSASGVPLLKAQWPANWVAATEVGSPPVATINRTPPVGVVLMPAIAKVQVLFALVVNDIYEYPLGTPVTDAVQLHGPQGDYFRGTKYKYELDLQYTPIVTLHNPYNVAIECYNLGVEFVNVPFSATIYRNGIAQNTGLAPLDQMFYTDNELGLVNKRFGMKLRTKSSGGTPDLTAPVRLLPGEVKTFSPYLDPNHTWWDEQRGNRIYWDFDSKDAATNFTQNIVAIPGWRGDGLGFVLDWWNPAPMRIGGPDKEEGRWAGCIGMAPDDRLYIVFAPQSMPLSNNKFIVQIAASATASAATTVVNAIEFDYETATGLRKFVFGKDDGTLRYPATGDIGTMEMFDHQKVAIKDRKNARPFCLISAQAKATSGGRDASNVDGRLATKPWCFAHANIGASSQKVVTDHSANHSHEIDFQALTKATGSSNLVQVDLMDRGNFVSGHTPFNGTKFGGQYDIPLAPIQSFANLNGANPGGSSVFLPRFAQPIGNSWAHPLIATAKLSETKASGNYVDHSFLLNLALYDNYYFSGLAAQIGPFGSPAKTTEALAKGFAGLTGGVPLDDPRLVFRPPNGKTAAAFTAEVAKADAYSRVAPWQLMAGPFNINSTSVLAWKAMLASIHDTQSLFNQLNKGAVGVTPGSKLSDLKIVGKEEARLSRFRLPVSTSAADGADLKISRTAIGSARASIRTTSCRRSRKTSSSRSGSAARSSRWRNSSTAALVPGIPPSAAPSNRRLMIPISTRAWPMPPTRVSRFSLTK
ncbi:MAG: hypothetical protein NTW21_21975 [Verrucomicrobia bacterium]|nr:hypothetical protein [Verrucomicrobiota bacterium]